MIFFFFKQKTAYEMRISDWSSDVCSSDLATPLRGERGMIAIREFLRKPKHRKNPDIPSLASIAPMRRHRCSLAITRQIGRASCRERVCQCRSLWSPYYYNKNNNTENLSYFTIHV